MQIECRDNRLRIVQEGRHRKFVPQIEQICYNAGFAAEEGRIALFVTERGVFDVGPNGLRLIEIAPGVDLERDILANMAFRPEIAADLKMMDARLFSEQPMGLGTELARAPEGRRKPRRTLN
ncbi:hypothetical protein ACFSS8_14520 [Paracoccus kondratievae]